MTARDGFAVSPEPTCVCGRPKSYHTERPAAAGAPWHPYTIHTGRHERGCLVISGPHDASLCNSLWERSCGDAKRHPSHTFLRMDVLFLCPGVEDLACPCGSGSPEMYEGPLRDCPNHGERGTEGER